MIIKCGYMTGCIGQCRCIKANMDGGGVCLVVDVQLGNSQCGLFVFNISIGCPLFIQKF